MKLWYLGVPQKVSRNLESNDFKGKLPEGRNIYSGGQPKPAFNKYLCRAWWRTPLL